MLSWAETGFQTEAVQAVKKSKNVNGHIKQSSQKIELNHHLTSYIGLTTWITAVRHLSFQSWVDIETNISLYYLCCWAGEKQCESKLHWYIFNSASRKHFHELMSWFHSFGATSQISTFRVVEVWKVLGFWIKCLKLLETFSLSTCMIVSQKVTLVVCSRMTSDLMWWRY